MENYCPDANKTEIFYQFSTKKGVKCDSGRKSKNVCLCVDQIEPRSSGPLL